uniref:Uncharacterized protein n=1 Tax=Rhizophora mucronata TaxID=61149 RepID=A0A2P2QS80_RHIMU
MFFATGNFKISCYSHAVKYMFLCQPHLQYPYFSFHIHHVSKKHSCLMVKEKVKNIISQWLSQFACQFLWFSTRISLTQQLVAYSSPFKGFKLQFLMNFLNKPKL